MLLPAALLLGLAACAGGEGDSGAAELPPADSVPWPDDTVPDTFYVDTSLGETGGDTEPAHTLTIRYEGAWSLTPAGGPYAAMTGALVLTELLDGDEEEPACAAEFSLTGQAVEEGCDSCVATFAVRHYLAAGDAEACRDPERPEDGDTWTLGWSRAERTVYLDLQGSGVWIPWFEAEELDDELLLSWEATLGVAVDEEDG